MIDLELVRERPDLVRSSQRARGEDDSLIDALLLADKHRRESVAVADAHRAALRVMSRAVRDSEQEQRRDLILQARELASQVDRAEAAEQQARSQLRRIHLRVGNIVERDVPAGGPADFRIVRTVGVPGPRDFSPRDHVSLGLGLGALDLDRGAKISGSRFYFLTGVGAQLQLALLNLAFSKAVRHGLTPMIPPVLVKPRAMEGTGYLGTCDDDAYKMADDDLYLVGTAEVPLAAYHSDEILDLENGALRYVGWSSCFRREAGSYGKDTRGIMRVHQFDKVEMFTVCSTEQADDEHSSMLALEEEMLAEVEIPYRVIETAAGDLGSSAARKYDTEAWMPSQACYREMTSSSNCTTYQARRLNIRHRTSEGEVELVATLNGTLATTRWLAAILENHQKEDGSVAVPRALQPGLDGRKLLVPDP